MDWASRLEGGSSGSANYSYDPIGRLTGQSDAFPSFSGSNVSWTFGISPASQIASETRDNDGYAFTGISTANKGYTVNGLNQYTAVAGTGHTYDASGNLTGDGTNVYIYDGENRLVSATAAGQTATLTYDPLGRLFQVVKGAANTRFLYDGDALVGEYDSGGNLTNRYLHGSNIAADDPLLWYVGSGTGTKRYLHADHLGSIVAGTNAGAAPTINAYDEYGVPKSGNVGRFQYTGQIWLSELGLYHYKARLYSPSLGRFLQVDPVGYEGQLNLYAYVGDDPINTSDPTGLLGQGDNLSENDKICTGSLIKCAQGGGVTGGAAGVSQAFSEGRSGQQGGQAGGYAVPRVESMYAQRAASGDPYAALALDFGKDQPTNSLVPAARDAMVDALVIKHGGHIIGAGHFSRPLIASTREQRLAAMAEYRQIRAQLAAAYVRATQTDPNRRLNPGQIYDIHKPVFSAHGLSMRLFGGSSVTGTRAEAVMSAILWCPRCILQ